MVFGQVKLIEKIGLYRPIKCRLYLISLTSILSLQVHSFFEPDLDKLNYFRAHTNGRIRTDSISKHICSRWTFKMLKNPKCSKMLKFSKNFTNRNKVEKLKFFDDEIFGSNIELNLPPDWAANRLQIFIFLALWVILTTFGNEQLIVSRNSVGLARYQASASRVWQTINGRSRTRIHDSCRERN